LLEARPVVPDDPYTVARPLDAERARRGGAAELRAPARPVARASLRDRDPVDRLAVAQGDVAVRAGEVPREVVREPLRDADRAVALEDDGYLRLGQAERLRVRRSGGDERRQRN